MRLRRIPNAPAGPSLTAAQMFTLHLNPVKHTLNRCGIILKAKKIFRNPTRLLPAFPHNLRGSGARASRSNPRGAVDREQHIQGVDGAGEPCDRGLTIWRVVQNSTRKNLKSCGKA